VPASKSRQQVRDEATAARSSGELDSINAEAHAFAPAAAPATVLVKR
jgi:hypothetical protein